MRSARSHGLKVNRMETHEILADQDASTLHREYRQRYLLNQTIVGGIDKQWQADLADMRSIAKSNDG